MDPEPDEDSINVQDLQAQIDLSMAFAQSLASSWIKPRQNGGNTRRKELESEIFESTKRPTRLGVGATVSQSAQHSSREAARLKGQLVGKKRGRDNEEQNEARHADEEEDREEESRAGAIKKKVKVDPFAVSNKKKKQSLHDPSSAAGPSKRNSPIAEGKPKIQVISLTSFSNPGPFEPNWNKKETAKAEDTTKSNPPSKGGQVHSLDSAPPDANGKPLLNAEPPKPKDRPKSAYLSLVTPLSPNTKLSAELFRQPLLNLSDHSEDEADSPENPSSESPKKKRKRKKKKKHGVELGGANADPTPGTDTSKI